MAKKRQSATVKSKRVYLSQSDVPRHELDEALRVPTALVNEFGKKPTSPLNVAAALNLSPNSSHFRSICGAAVAYGLTDGGPFADEIKLTELGRRAVAPTLEGDDLAAKQQSLLRPRVIGDFLKRFEGSRLPRPDIAANILSEMGVPKEHRERVFGFVVDGAKSVGFLKTIKGADYVQLEGAACSGNSEPANGTEGGTSLDCTDETNETSVDVLEVDPAAFPVHRPPRRIAMCS